LTDGFEAGDVDAAESLARELVAADRHDEQALYLLARIVFRQKGRAEEAVERMRAVLEIDPANVSYNNDYGVMLASLGRWDEATAAYGMAAVLDPDDFDARFNLALSLMRTGQKERARAELDRVRARHPDLPDVLALEGELLCAEGEPARAVEAFAKAIARGLETSEVYVNLGLAQEDMNRGEEGEVCMASAIDSFKRAIELDSCSAEGWNNLGQAYFRLRRLDEAEEAYRRALGIRPDYAEADLNLGILLLLRGRFSEGWPRYEARWRMPRIARERPKFSLPEWIGDDLGSRTLLVYSEQGMGDNLQFARYLPLLRRRHPRARIYYWCPRALWRLFESRAAAWGIEMLRWAEEPPPFDAHVALLSLP
jgi:Flp pilus assembly protein TadD